MIVEKFLKELKKIFKLFDKKEKSRLTKIKDIKFSTPKKYLAEIQSIYMRNDLEASSDTKEKEEDFFAKYVRSLFMKGFCDYINGNFGCLKELIFNEDKKSDIDMRLRNYKCGSDVEIDKLIAEIKIENIPDLSYNKHKYFYLFIKLLDSKELNNFKGNIEKTLAIYKRDKEKDLSEELKIINLLLLADETKESKVFKNDDIIVLGKFLDLEIEGKSEKDAIEILKEFQINKTNNIYCDGENLIEKKSLYNLKKHCMGDVLSRIIEKANYKVKKDEINKYLDFIKKDMNSESEIEKSYKEQKKLHDEYVKSGTAFKDANKYKKVIEKIDKYNKLKNKIELNDINLIQSILLRILHRMVGYTSLWERDLKFILTSSFKDGTNDNQKIENIFDYTKQYGIKKGKTLANYKEFLKNIDKHHKFSDDEEEKNKEIETIKVILPKAEFIRNNAAHFNYLPTPKASILTMLENLRKLMDYDRKLKNAVLKSVKKIFDEYGFNVEFKIEVNKKISVVRVASKDIVHLKKLGKNNIKVPKHSEELCKALKTMLEYKV